jgi:hypothetical protein
MYVHLVAVAAGLDRDAEQRIGPKHGEPTFGDGNRHGPNIEQTRT